MLSDDNKETYGDVLQGCCKCCKVLDHVPMHRDMICKNIYLSRQVFIL